MEKEKRFGCGIYPLHPQPCQNYFCANDPPEIQLLLIKRAQESGNVSEKLAREAKERIKKGELEPGKNIWNQDGCDTGEGTLCDACCTVKGFIDPNWGENGFIKEIGVTCPSARRPQGRIIGQ